MPLTFVPTPLGNLGDITLRALRVLRDCDLLIAEDTRVARKLLSALALPPKTIWSYREHNAHSVTPAILERATLQKVAVVCDAGMPAISDPGRALVTAARDANVPVDVLPGPSAFLCGAVLSGFEMPPLTLEGFVPRSQRDRERALRSALGRKGTTVFFESPRRIAASLNALAAIAPDARVFVGRELTKLHEQQLTGTPATVLANLTQPVLGEIVLVVASGGGSRDGTAHAASGSEDPTVLPSERRLDVDAAIEAALASGMPSSVLAKKLVRAGYGERHDLYDRIVRRRKTTSGAATPPGKPS